MANKKKNMKPKKNGGVESSAVVAAAFLAVVVLIIVACICAAVSAKRTQKLLDDYNSADDSDNAAISQPLEKDESYAPPEFNISHYAEIDIKDYGKITVGLDSSAAPETVANFVKLASEGFYDGLTFHRIMSGFMMQGGDPEGTGFGGSDTTIKGEFSSNGVDNPLSHVRGAISMARSKKPDSASSQFFIVHKDSTSLDGDYAVFGYVTEGIEVVDAVCKAARPIDDNGTITASEQPIINSITIREAEQE